MEVLSERGNETELAGDHGTEPEDRLSDFLIGLPGGALDLVKDPAAGPVAGAHVEQDQPPDIRAQTEVVFEVL
ncbi:MAG: hypothetical protein ACE5FK_05605 [Candidatus Methylomirabilia bacterium]